MRPIHIALATALALAAALPAGAETPFQCSGIGVEERESAESVPHTLRLIFAQPQGDYLGGVATRISQGGAALVDVTCPGPWLLVDLPDGTYEVTADFQGKTKTSQVTISGGRRLEQVFAF